MTPVLFFPCHTCSTPIASVLGNTRGSSPDFQVFGQLLSPTLFPDPIFQGGSRA